MRFAQEQARAVCLRQVRKQKSRHQPAFLLSGTAY
jgi:hypothetical protein